MIRTAGRQRAFTLVEMLVAILITGVISVALVQMLQVGQRSSDRNKVLVEMQQNVRVGLQSLGEDLRHVSYGKDPTQPSIHYAGPDSVTFIADLMPEHAGAERVSFFLSPQGDPDTPNPNDTILMRVVTDTAGVVLVSAPQAYGIAANGLSFRWFNGGGTELANPVPQPEQIGEIFVSVTAAASKLMSGTYPTLALSSTIYPRNLPLSPARSRPNSPGCGSLTFPNCESATMSWTTPTTNTDGTTLPLSDISHFALYFGTDPNDLSLYTKLARTINQWTINGLADGLTYYLAVTAVSRSGVESYKCTQSADMSSASVPEAPDTLISSNWLGAGVQLDWGAVTHFTTGTSITTPVRYMIYRGSTPGFTPDPGNLLATVSYATQYVDTTLAGCSMFYYKVRAKACGNEGDPTPQASGSLPAPPSSPAGLTAVGTSTAGDILLSWTPPPTRLDGTVLDPGDINGYVIYADTVAGTSHPYQQIYGAVSSTTVTGLIPCQTYYLNLVCVDACNHMGEFRTANEVSVFTVSPCLTGPPSPPAALALTPYDDRVSLQWPANQVDCDLEGYRVYYGPTPGGPYNGTGAAEGSSPIHRVAASVTQGDVCRLDLTGLGSCQNYYVKVAATDLCSPSNESALSPEAGGMTTCTPCQTGAACIAWAVDGAGNTGLHLEVYTTNGGGETLTRLTPTYSGSAKVREVWYGRPLAKIWASDGSAGNDGNVGPQPSGTVLDIDDTTVPSWTSIKDGQPMKIVFDSDVRDLAVNLSFRGLSGTCTGSGTGRGASLVDDFDDGNYTGWTSVSGTWGVTSGELRQSLTGSNYVLRHSTLNLGDLTYEAKILASGGSQHSAYLVFRYQNSSNYYVCGIRTDTDRVRLGRIAGGNWASEPASYAMTLNDNQWYNFRVVVTGTRVQAWIDCQKVIDVTDAAMWATGNLGLSTRQTTGKFDDVKIFAGAVLP